MYQIGAWNWIHEYALNPDFSESGLDFKNPISLSGLKQISGSGLGIRFHALYQTI